MKIRDPIHVFVTLDDDERVILNCSAFQRLRHIHQLALTYLVYPGASHKRFEHSLGVMEVASRIFDIVTSREKLSDEVQKIVPTEPKRLSYWRSVLRVAALCHDLGHLPFSHGAEAALFPKGWEHEDMTRQIIESDQMRSVFEAMTPTPKTEHVVKLALGKKAKGVAFTPWEQVLAEIITGNVFGADRIDYLLRDSHHVGVAYGQFDHHRLVQTLRILPDAPTGSPDDQAEVSPAGFQLGVERGGLESAEALLIARYFMFTQVYFHKARAIYDLHLQEFMTQWFVAKFDGKYPIEVEPFLAITDNEVLTEISKAAASKRHPAHLSARRIAAREHYRAFYSRDPADQRVYLEAAQAIFIAAKKRFGAENVKYRDTRKHDDPQDFVVRDWNGQSVSSLTLSKAVVNLPEPLEEFVYINPDLRTEADAWLRQNRKTIIEKAASREVEK